MLRKLLFLPSLCIIFLFSFSTDLRANENSKVLILAIKDEINQAMSRYVTLGLDQAKKDSVNYIVIDMDTYGGEVKAADEIRLKLLNSKIPVYVFINDNAGSAGSLIAISCDSIYMTKSAIMGASSVIDQNGTIVAEKFQSFMRSKMRATAEAKGRNPLIAERMVGVNLQSKDSAHVLALTAQEAINEKYCEGIFSSLDEILIKNLPKNYTKSEFKLDATESIIAFFLNPAVKSILILLIIGGIFMEMKAPGLGFPILIAFVALLCYFIPNYLYGFAQHWEIVMFVFGVSLLMVEIFLIPGFGFVGIAGIILLFASLFLALINNDGLDFTSVSFKQITTGVAVTVFGLSTFVILFLTFANTFANSSYFKAFAVTESMDKQSFDTTELKKLIGEIGVCNTDFKPSGRVEIKGQLFDARLDHGTVGKGTEVTVISIDFSELIVRKNG